VWVLLGLFDSVGVGLDGGIATSVVLSLNKKTCVERKRKRKRKRSGKRD
jgi:hypothetical protein